MAQEKKGSRPGDGNSAPSKLAEALTHVVRELSPADREDVHDPDFQFALRELLQAYKPLLEADLARVDAPDELTKEVLEAGPNCEDEFAAADQLLGRFLTEEVAVRLLPANARELLGPIERWRWCLLHIRCCIIFGWLLCRRPHPFRTSN